ncbi:TPA: tyrosine-type recombinase/integrase [Shewanella algae]|uniref:tyrosine-type recombinase/integrase n=1 Tax=Shewanella algae TaxID=38313 RepID=UPI001C5A4720|nr:tyrosine-type recombinase/integrase [Shewanella algae]HDS1208908.1 tyrosine-type recombinase/integrase [Shewanella algae]
MVGKRKNKADSSLPLRVYRGRSAFEWKPKGGGTVRLCSLDSPMSEVWRQYEAVSSEAENASTVSGLVSRFFASADFIELSKETQKDYRKYSKNILAVFGSMHVDKVEPQHIRIYMDKRGIKSRIQANREHAFFSRCYRFGYERGLCKGNPCKGVRKFKEEARKRYITDMEYNELYKNASAPVKVAMELAYLCCARQGDVLAMRTSQILEEGIFIAQGKTGAEQIKLWSPRLRAAIELSKTLSAPGVASTFVVCKPDGGKWTRDGFNSRWSEDRRKTRELTGLPLDFTFHDLKAKGISDIDGTLQEKQAISGHKNANQTAIYDRKIKQVYAVDSAKK